MFPNTVNAQVVCERSFLPVCVLRCAFRCELLVYTLLQPVKSQRWIRRFFSESGESAGRGCFVPEWTITDGLLPLWETQREREENEVLMANAEALHVTWPGEGAVVSRQMHPFCFWNLNASLIWLQLLHIAITTFYQSGSWKTPPAFSSVPHLYFVLPLLSFLFCF